MSGESKLEKLAVAINKSLEEKQKIEVQHKRMDLELRQAIANISHDLRTPLTSIMGYVQLLEEDSIPEEERKQYLDIIKRRSKNLKMLVESFYDLSRLEAGEYKFELKALNISVILCDILASFYNDFLNKGIEPQIDIDEGVLSVIADEGAVRRIFSNMIQNILRYGESPVSISLKQQEGCIITAFENNATNLKEEDVSRLFERSFTADQTRTEKSTGLGLAITKQLVEQMGHAVTAHLENQELSIEIKWRLE
jgi:Signal transduction histidine kinase